MGASYTETSDFTPVNKVQTSFPFYDCRIAMSVSLVNIGNINYWKW